MSRSDKYVSAGPGVFGVYRPRPLIATRSCTNGVLNASVFHGEAVYHFAEGHERILQAGDQRPKMTKSPQSPNSGLSTTEVKQLNLQSKKEDNDTLLPYSVRDRRSGEQQ